MLADFTLNPQKFYLTVHDLDEETMSRYIIEHVRYESPNRFQLFVKEEFEGGYRYPDIDEPTPEETSETTVVPELDITTMTKEEASNLANELLRSLGVENEEEEMEGLEDN